MTANYSSQPLRYPVCVLRTRSTGRFGHMLRAYEQSSAQLLWATFKLWLLACIAQRRKGPAQINGDTEGTIPWEKEGTIQRSACNVHMAFPMVDDTHGGTLGHNSVSVICIACIQVIHT